MWWQMAYRLTPAEAVSPFGQAVLECSSMTAVAELCRDAIDRLRAEPAAITAESVHSWPSTPGLYAVYGPPTVWQTLQLGDPPDGRPLYVGKSQRSLSSRDVITHFGFADAGANSITGSSTLRRSISALLRDSFSFRGQFRNPAKPERADKFGLAPHHDAELSTWMRTHLVATYWNEARSDVPLSDVETAVLRHWSPPLNLQKVRHQWTGQIRAARKKMAADCNRSNLGPAD